MSNRISLSNRISQCFESCRRQRRAALVTFITAGDPSLEISQKILQGLPEAGADIIELGMPFSDPMAEGIPVQRSSERALQAGQTMARTLEMVQKFREGDDKTPIILMGYYNSVYFRTVEKFVQQASQAGVDGMIIVDLPPESDRELREPANAAGLDLIRLATPTTDASRLPVVLKNLTGFLYYVSITGTTGAAAPDISNVAAAIKKIKDHDATPKGLPIAVGFGIKSAKQAREMAAIADGVVVGSALVETIRNIWEKQVLANDPQQQPGDIGAAIATAIHDLVAELSAATRWD